MSITKQPVLLFLITEDWFFASHFMARAKAAQAAGYRVIVLCGVGPASQSLRAAGIEVVEVAFIRRRINPIAELILSLSISKIYRRLAPDIVHHIALKPIILGSIAARLAGVRHIVNAPVGMGFVFTSQSLKARLLRPLMNLALRLTLNPPGSVVILENRDDVAGFAASGLVARENITLIRGAGVDIARFVPHPAPSGVPQVVMVARMLRDKGVGEFVAAARLLWVRQISCRMVLVGAPDAENPNTVPASQLSAWQDEGVIEWRGAQSDIPAILAEAIMFCLPSYREGLPKSILEAMAAGLPVVATDVPGCREAVTHEATGLLVPARDAPALAAAIARLLAEPATRARMGAAGRQAVLAEFSDQIITMQTLAVYRALTQQADPT
jgi:glycosyltransferase involved in cell wall biosynthesis